MLLCVLSVNLYIWLFFVSPFKSVVLSLCDVCCEIIRRTSFRSRFMCFSLGEHATDSVTCVTLLLLLSFVFRVVL